MSILISFANGYPCGLACLKRLELVKIDDTGSYSIERVLALMRSNQLGGGGIGWLGGGAAPIGLLMEK